jgi:hypothetical protein
MYIRYLTNKNTKITLRTEANHLHNSAKSVIPIGQHLQQKNQLKMPLFLLIKKFDLIFTSMREV